MLWPFSVISLVQATQNILPGLAVVTLYEVRSQADGLREVARADTLAENTTVITVSLSFQNKTSGSEVCITM